MDLFKLHKIPESLVLYDKKMMMPKYFYPKFKDNHGELIKREKYIALDPYYALHYAIGR